MAPRGDKGASVLVATELPDRFLTAAASVGILPPVQVLLARMIETLAPSRLGRSFRWLLASTVINNAGDGIALAAGPLLVASETRDTGSRLSAGW